MAVFTWDVRVGTAGSAEFRTKKSQFGDGYSQEFEDGLNSEVQSWPISMVGYESAIAPPLEFLRTHGGATSFQWTPPLGVQGWYRCKSYGITGHGNDAYTLTADFQQVFAP